jgi:RimJ/RimL family protein N-acetyltransferase
MTGPSSTLVRALQPDEARLLRDDPAQFADVSGLGLAVGYLAFPEALERIVAALDDGEPPEWSSHLIIDPATSTVVGLGGFKGPPRGGVVEVGYSVAPDHRGRGHATNAVMAWVRQAAAAGAGTVMAHTLAGPNASTRVLERCGFERSAVLPDDRLGETWQWRLDVAARD